MPLLPEREPVDLVRNVIGVASRADRADGETSVPWDRALERGAREERAPLGTVLAGRQSVREFADAGLSLDDLTRVLRLAESSQLRQWSPEGLSGLTVLAAPYRVEALEARWLRLWNGADGWWDPLSAPSWLPELQERYAAAPCLLLICGTVGRAGACGYGRLLVRAGALGYAIWLSARTYGLASSVYASTSLEVTRELRGLEHTPRHLFTLALGRAPEAADG
jgi:hypothetical protein